MKDRVEERASEYAESLVINPSQWEYKFVAKEAYTAAMKEERERGKRFFRWYTNYKNNTHEGQEDELFNEFLEQENNLTN